MSTILIIIIAIALCVWIYRLFDRNKAEEYRESDNTSILEIEIIEENTEESVPQAPQTTQVSAKLSPELYKRLNGYCDYKGLSKTYVINEAVAKYLDEIENNINNKENK